MKVIVVLVMVFLGAVHFYAQEAVAPLQSTMTAFLVEKNDAGNDVLTKTEQVKPGQVIEYALAYSNVTDNDLKEISIIGPIPTGAFYLLGTATQSAEVKPEFSIDGGNKYQSEPVKYMVKQADGTEVERVATPDMYTHVRWTLGTLVARQNLTLNYRVQVR